MRAHGSASYVTDRRSIRYTPDGRRIVTGGWMIVTRVKGSTDAAWSYVEGAIYGTKRAAQAALQSAR